MQSHTLESSLKHDQKIAYLIILSLMILVGIVFAFLYFLQKQEISLVATQTGYITNIYNEEGDNYLDIDYIQWFTREEAKQKAFADGKCQKLEACAPDGFYFTNSKNQIRTFKVADDAKIILQNSKNSQTNNSQEQELTFDAFIKLWNKEKIRLITVPFHIDIYSGEQEEVIKIVEQHMP